MIEANRSYESRRNATRRDHLMPVMTDTAHAALARATWRDWVAVLLVAAVVVGMVAL